ncbi:hypothetical protein R3Q06_25440 [Rhodococcus erythropolis]|uniref:hypothetical protein n=1 Tax=Rhodococcus erythropolis TaxID=1833 RepID=UPI00294A7AE6|nr:hypothetical protein [Rhodococcus erythropolis]MDV6276847.1 hypothetical protein [Rhodococcus erythropolis]
MRWEIIDCVAAGSTTLLDSAVLSIFAVMGILGACESDPSMIVSARLGRGIGAGTISSQVLGIITDRVSGKAASIDPVGLCLPLHSSGSDPSSPSTRCSASI